MGNWNRLSMQIDGKLRIFRAEYQSIFSSKLVRIMLDYHAELDLIIWSIWWKIYEDSAVHVGGSRCS
jgi:hypothetical protein